MADRDISEHFHSCSAQAVINNKDYIDNSIATMELKMQKKRYFFNKVMVRWSPSIITITPIHHLNVLCGQKSPCTKYAVVSKYYYHNSNPSLKEKGFLYVVKRVHVQNMQHFCLHRTRDVQATLGLIRRSRVRSTGSV